MAVLSLNDWVYIYNLETNDFEEPVFFRGRHLDARGIKWISFDHDKLCLAVYGPNGLAAYRFEKSSKSLQNLDPHEKWFTMDGDIEQIATNDRYLAVIGSDIRVIDLLYIKSEVKWPSKECFSVLPKEYVLTGYKANTLEIQGRYLAVGYRNQEKSMVKIVDLYKFEVQNIVIEGQIQRIHFTDTLKFYTENQVHLFQRKVQHQVVLQQSIQTQIILGIFGAFQDLVKWPFQFLTYHFSGIPTFPSTVQFFEKSGQQNIPENIVQICELATLIYEDKIEVITEIGKIKLPEEIFPEELGPGEVQIQTYKNVLIVLNKRKGRLIRICVEN